MAGNVGLVLQISRKYAMELKRSVDLSGGNGVGSILTLQDMIQEGNLGIMEAAERFDPTKGARFGTYASYWIKQRILRSIADHSRTIRLPAHGTFSFYLVAFLDFIGFWMQVPHTLVLIVLLCVRFFCYFSSFDLENHSKSTT